MTLYWTTKKVKPLSFGSGSVGNGVWGGSETGKIEGFVQAENHSPNTLTSECSNGIKAASLKMLQWSLLLPKLKHSCIEIVSVCSYWGDTVSWRRPKSAVSRESRDHLHFSGSKQQPKCHQLYQTRPATHVTQFTGIYIKPFSCLQPSMAAIHENVICCTLEFQAQVSALFCRDDEGKADMATVNRLILVKLCVRSRKGTMLSLYV